MTMNRLAELHALERQLREEGLPDAARRVQAIRRELVLLEQPPAWFKRVGGRLAARMRGQWGRLAQELDETCEAGALVARALRDGPRSLDAGDRRRLRAQILDLLKTVPSMAIFVGLFFVPLPGAQALAPFFLSRLQLLPSSWRQTWALNALDETAARFDASGDLRAAERLRAVRGRLAADVAELESLRRFLDSHPEYTLLFDDDFDGRLDADELARAQELVRLVRAVGAERGHERIWYAFLGEAVCGPYRLAELDVTPFRERALVSWERSGAWAPLRSVLPGYDPTQNP